MGAPGKPIRAGSAATHTHPQLPWCLVPAGWRLARPQQAWQPNIASLASWQCRESVGTPHIVTEAKTFAFSLDASKMRPCVAARASSPVSYTVWCLSK